MKMKKILGYAAVPALTMCLVYGFQGDVITSLAKTITTIVQTVTITRGTLADVTNIPVDVPAPSAESGYEWIPITLDGDGLKYKKYALTDTIMEVETQLDIPDEVSPQTTPSAKPVVKPENNIEFQKPSQTEGNLANILSIKIEQQGEKCMAAFDAAAGSEYIILYSVNINTTEGATYDNKTGRLTITLPKRYVFTGKQYAMIGVDKQGQTKVFPDLDQVDDSLTADLNMDGYAFGVAYKK